MHTGIAKEFNFSSLLRFAMPTIVMMIFTSLYTIVDGIFVSRFVGTDALSAVNIVYPMLNVVLAVSVMLSTGGSAVVARRLGEGRQLTARQNFACITVVGALAGVLIGVVGLLLLEPICLALGSSEALLPYCKDYLSILLMFAPASMLQVLFQSFFVTAGKPVLGLGLTVVAGVTNAVLDYLLIVPLEMGVSGAAWATGIGNLIPAVCGLVYFIASKNPLRFARPRLDWQLLRHSCLNGSSEMVTNISAGIITYLFNRVMMRYLGTDGVAAITIVLYAQFLLTALYLGFSMGVAPVISYNHGSGNHLQMRRVVRICMTFVAVSSVAVFGLSLVLSDGIVSVFSQRGTAVYEIAIHGFLLFSLSFLFAGLNIFASGMFTALSNGLISAIISFLRTFVFIIAGLLLLPYVWELNGVWLAVPAAELLTMVLSAYFLWHNRGRYHYGTGGSNSLPNSTENTPLS